MIMNMHQQSGTVALHSSTEYVEIIIVHFLYWGGEHVTVLVDYVYNICLTKDGLVMFLKTASGYF